MLEENFHLIMDNWQQLHISADLPTKLSQFSGSLKAWTCARFADTPRKIESLRRELNGLLNLLQAQNNGCRIAELEHRVDKMVCQEEFHWNQRARINWLAQGDGNTKFFHVFASERKRINHIKGLFDDKGQWCANEKDIADINLKYFAQLFSSSKPLNHEIEKVTASFSSGTRFNEQYTLCTLYKI